MDEYRIPQKEVWLGFLADDPYCDIDPFDQGEVHFNITSEVNCASEEYVEKERIFAVIDDDDDNDGEFLPRAISSSDDSE